MCAKRHSINSHSFLWWSWSLGLGGVDVKGRERCVAYFTKKTQAYKAEHPDIDLSKHKWIINVSQSVQFQPRHRDFQLDLMPALLRSSKFFLDCMNEKDARFIHPLEVMAMQGLPDLLPADHFASQSCNFQRTLDESGIPLQQMALLSGNGMNLSSIGQVIFFCLACVGSP